MKKLLALVMVCLCLTGCKKKTDVTSDANDKYLNMIELVRSYDTFSDASEYFRVESEVANIGQGAYRFYIFIDKPKVAMYDIEAIAIEENVDYTDFMAANIGIYETSVYNMIPNQVNVDRGYAAGVIISGLTSNPNASLYMLVQWKNKDLSESYKEYLKIDLKYIGN